MRRRIPLPRELGQWHVALKHADIAEQAQAELVDLDADCASYRAPLDDWLNQPLWNVRDLSLYINEENRKEVERLRKAVL